MKNYVETKFVFNRKPYVEFKHRVKSKGKTMKGVLEEFMAAYVNDNVITSDKILTKDDLMEILKTK